MKKIYGFLGALALVATASCSKQELGNQDITPDAKGDLFMTMNISQRGTTSRTATPDQGVEVGKDGENKVSDALVIFAHADNTIFKSIHVLATGGDGSLVGTNSDYIATFQMERNDLLADIKANGTPAGNGTEISYNVYVIGNPTDAMISAYTGSTPTTQVQSLIELSEDGAAYWTENKFLMSSAYVESKKIEAAQIPVGSHATAGTALPLGTVRIQRAMSRFDFETENTVFEAKSDKNPLKQVTLTFDGLALVNQATKANLFKVTSEYEDGQDGLAAEYGAFEAGKTLKFNDEKVGNYVFSPVQTAFTLPLYGGAVANGRLGGAPKAFTEFEYVDPADLEETDNTYTHPGSSSLDEGNYKIWRYCMENTNYDKMNQYHGNSTGIILRAYMTFGEEGNKYTAPIYAFSNVILGDAETLRTYVVNQKPENDPTSDVYELVTIRYKAAVEEYNGKTSGTKFTFDSEAAEGYKKITEASAEELKALDSYLVDREFSIYRPAEDGKFYCYYTYWNRHNDNGPDKLTVMGPMEFATVRNNVYKIKVNTVNRLGHPGQPGDDPDPEDPGTPDEEDHLYLSVECKILPWEVRMNGLDL